MSKCEHRRKDLAGGAPDDPDWTASHTTPSFGLDAGAGEIRPLSPAKSSIIVSAELFDDQGAPIDPAGVTITVQMLSRARVGGVEVFDGGKAQTLVALQRRLIELQVGKGLQYWVRITDIAGAPATGTIRLYAVEDVKV